MPKPYEITYISDSSLNDEARTELDAAIDSAISDLGGNISRSAANVRRRLLSPIQKQVAGFLRSLNIQLDPEQVATLRTNVKKKKGVLRAAIFQTDERPEVTPDMLFTAPAADTRGQEKVEKKPAKEITATDVEAAIEEALKEEVK